MRFSVLGSGSRGNCIYIESKETALLIDAGFSGREIASRLAAVGGRIERVCGIFVTHEHQDHISGVGVLSRRCRLPVYANERTFQGADKTVGRLAERHEFATGAAIDVGDVRIRSFAISHDAGDPVGYLIDDGSVRLGICTDTGHASRLISRRLSNCDALIIEFNHDPVLLKNGPYPPSLQQRVRSNIGHLANNDAAHLLASVRHDRLRRVVLAHLSETNNRPELAYREAIAALGGESAELVIEPADQHRPTRLFDLSQRS